MSQPSTQPDTDDDDWQPLRQALRQAFIAGWQAGGAPHDLRELDLAFVEWFARQGCLSIILLDERPRREVFGGNVRRNDK